MRVVLATGGFDPLHSGHISYLKESKKLGDILVVGINSDDWLIRKKGKAFMGHSERIEIVKNLSIVDSVIRFNDDDGSANDAINQCLSLYPQAEVVFVNGGDRIDKNIPETKISDKRLTFVFGVGGCDKLNSSSKILQDWKNPKTYRSWGYYRVLHSDGPETKVKELTVNPKSSLSLQRHKYRSEHWFVSHGVATVKLGVTHDSLEEIILNKHDKIRIPKYNWHKLINDSCDELRIIEIQYGDMCTEEDIERL